MNIYDLIIIGAGPAGMTAAVFAVRKGLKTLVITKDVGGQVIQTSSIENYMGFQAINGQELMEKFQTQVKELRVEEKLTEIASLRREKDYFRVSTKNGEDYYAWTIILSSGKKPRSLNVPGEAEYQNKGVSYCSTCDSPLFRGAPVAVVGGGNSALQSVFDLSQYATEIHLIAQNGLTADAILVERLRSIPNLRQYLSHTVTSIQGGRMMERIMAKDLTTGAEIIISVEGIFIEIGSEPNTEFVDPEVERNEQNEIVVDCLCRTNVPGFFSAGDVTSIPEKQVIIAAGEGAKAAIKAWEYLLIHEGANQPVVTV